MPASQPKDVKEALTKLGAYATVKADLDDRGLIDDAIAAAIDQAVAALRHTVGVHLQQPAGSPPLLVKFEDKLYVFVAGPDGVPDFAVDDPVDAETVGLTT